MKKLLSLLTLTLAIALSSYAKTTIKISNPAEPTDIKKQVINALKEKSPALANDAAFVADVVKQVQDEVKKAKTPGVKVIKISKQTPQAACADIYIYTEITDYYDGDGNYIGSEIYQEILIIIYPC